MKHLNQELIKTCSIPIFQRLMINFLLLQKAHEAKIEYLKCVKVPDLHRKFLGLDRQEVIKRKQILFRRKQLVVQSDTAKLVKLPGHHTKGASTHYFSHLKVKQPRALPCRQAHMKAKKYYNFTATPI